MASFHPLLLMHSLPHNLMPAEVNFIVVEISSCESDVSKGEVERCGVITPTVIEPAPHCNDELCVVSVLPFGAMPTESGIGEEDERAIMF